MSDDGQLTPIISPRITASVAMQCLPCWSSYRTVLNISKSSLLLARKNIEISVVSQNISTNETDISLNQTLSRSCGVAPTEHLQSTVAHLQTERLDRNASTSLISSPVSSFTFLGASNKEAAARVSCRRLPSRDSDARTLIVRSSGRPSDSANTSAGGAYAVCECWCSDSWGVTTSGAGGGTADAFSVVQSSARGAAGAGTMTSAARAGIEWERRNTPLALPRP